MRENWDFSSSAQSAKHGRVAEIVSEVIESKSAINRLGQLCPRMPPRWQTKPPRSHRWRGPNLVGGQIRSRSSPIVFAARDHESSGGYSQPDLPATWQDS